MIENKPKAPLSSTLVSMCTFGSVDGCFHLYLFPFTFPFIYISSLMIALLLTAVELEWQLKFSSFVVSLELKSDRTRRCHSFYVTHHIKIFLTDCEMILELN